jgi:hypothetical protein
MCGVLALDQRAAIKQAVAGNNRRRIAVTTIANAHDVLLADRGKMRRSNFL